MATGRSIPIRRRARSASRHARTAWLAAGGLAATIATATVCAADAAVAVAEGSAMLPPARAWAGASRALVAPADDPWRTPCEESGFARTPRYDATMAWLRRLCDATPDLHLVEYGRSSEGRALWMVLAARGVATPGPTAVQARRRPLVFVQAGIHAGEIDGKDAGLMLLRDLRPERRLGDLLDRVDLVFVPIFNVDGHERFSPFGRINQRGPEACGWRTTALNLNLNRDYAKLDAPEMRAMIRALQAWEPDLYIDLHVTDGGDYAYDITWGANGAGGWSPACRVWLDGTLTPAAVADLERMGHIPGPFVGPEESEPSRGMVNPTMSPRFSNGYGDARHLPTILVENHSLKPYEQRVLGTYVLLESMLRTVARDAPALRAAIAADRSRRDREVVLDWRSRRAPPYRTIAYRGVDSRQVTSPVSGARYTEWLGSPHEVQLPLIDQDEPVVRVARPRAYWIPGAWAEVGERLGLHGIRVEPQAEARTLDVEVLRIVEARLDSVPFEGRVRVTPRVERVRRRQVFAPGSTRVPTDQPLGDLAMLLLEPESPDSFFQWGFFHAVLQQTEYAEPYIMEPMAARMLESSPDLRAEFERRVREDARFAADPKARLDWFYRRTSFYDATSRLYPIARE